MANIEIQVSTVEPFAEGQSFGEAGSYLRIRGTAKGELDPAASQNLVIVELPAEHTAGLKLQLQRKRIDR